MATKAKTITRAAAVKKRKPKTAPKKAVVKKLSKKPVTRKKTTTAKTKQPTKLPAKKPASAKKPAKKVLPKAAATTGKVVTKKVVRINTPKTTTNKRALWSAAQPVVVLPDRLSIRVREKALVLADAFEKDFYVPGFTLAKFGGFGFMLIGSFAIYGQLYTQDSALLCDTTECIAGQQASVVGVALLGSESVAKPSTFSVLTKIPAVLTRPLDIVFDVSHATSVSGVLRFTNEQGKQEQTVQATKLGNNKYELFIDPTDLVEAQYELVLRVTSNGATSETHYVVGAFTVQTSASESASTTAAVFNAQNRADAELISTIRPVVSGVATITLENYAKYTQINFFLRQLQGLNSQPIGSMLVGAATYRFDSTKFPNGVYELFADAAQGDLTTLTQPQQFEINNPTQFSQDIEQLGLPEREFAAVRSVLTLAPVGELAIETATSSIETPTLQQVILTRLADDADELERYLITYAVAIQAADPAMITRATAEITKYQEQLAQDLLSDSQSRFTARLIDDAIEQQLATLKQKVVVFESLRTERTEADSSIDTDSDGISDIDELMLYQTDPMRADTDNDGFTDGAEILTGNNPTSAAIESAINYQSPKTTVGLRSNKLQVVSVVPQVQPQLADDTTAVYATIRGVGLPNSFVTMYLFSTPSIATVRTDAQGSFEHTFSTNLADGEHHVYVALVDNAGSIVTQSHEYTFKKDDQEFIITGTPIEPPVAGATSDTTSVAIDRILLAVAVFALGMLLVFLGSRLRFNKPASVNSNLNQA